MAVEDSVAQDQLRAFIERIERMEEEKAAIAADIKEIYAEAKGNGFDTKVLRKVVAIRKQDANERLEQEAILDLYMGALGMVAAPPEDDDYSPRFGSNTSRAPASLDDLVEQLACHVDPQLLMTIIEGSKTEAGRKIIMGALAAVNGGDVVSTAHIENIEPQPTKAVGSDLAASPALSGQVADIQPETVEQSAAANSGSNEDASPSSDESEASGDRTQITGPAGIPDAVKSVEALASAAPAPTDPLPGEVYWENTPRWPVKRHEYSAAFGTLGQDIHVITEDIAKAQSAAIVMMGDTILDGWARYNCARGMVGMNGQTTEYPAYQYDGTDPLLDCIRWNLQGRTLDVNQRQIIAKRLIEKEPKRKADIVKAFGFAMEHAA